jgi:tetratricopeptide (TPR) repeat protein
VGRAKVWLEQRELQKAINDCTQALKHSKSRKSFSHREIYSVRGDAYQELGDTNRAIADYEQTRRFDTTVARAYWQRAQQRKADGKASAADKDLKRAIALDPSLRQRR